MFTNLRDILEMEYLPSLLVKDGQTDLARLTRNYQDSVCCLPGKGDRTKVRTCMNPGRTII
jgi:hypothetical protein